MPVVEFQLDTKCDDGEGNPVQTGESVSLPRGIVPHYPEVSRKQADGGRYEGVEGRNRWQKD